MRSLLILLVCLLPGCIDVHEGHDLVWTVINDSDEAIDFVATLASDGQDCTHQGTLGPGEDTTFSFPVWGNETAVEIQIRLDSRASSGLPLYIHEVCPWDVNAVWDGMVWDMDASRGSC